jgi:hypothetical protein
MSSPQARKPKVENYEYSWFLPADGHNGSAVVSQVPSSELEGAGEGSDKLGVAAMEARTERWRHSGEHKSAHVRASSFSLEQARVRLAIVVGWSAIAGSGAVLLVARAGQPPSIQLGLLAGVWLGVSAAIWFLPGILSRGKLKA